MISQLRLENFILISEADLQFQSGFTVITGETGAGKSILASAIGLLLGQAATDNLIKAGAEFADIEGIFSFDPIPDGLADVVEDGRIMIFRRIKRNGQNIIRLNGVTVPLKRLKNLMGRWIQVSGQHDHLSLLQADMTLQMIDHFGHDDLKEVKSTFETAYHAYRNAKATLDRLGGIRDDREQKMAFIQFQLDDIHSQGFQQGEEDRLKQQRQHAKHATRLLDADAHIRRALTSIAESLDVAQQNLAKVDQLLTLPSAVTTSLQAVSSGVEQFQSEWRDATRTWENEQTDLDGIETRLDAMFTYKQKYKVQTIDALLDFADRQQRLLDDLKDLDGRLARYKKDEKQTLKTARISAKKLSSKRRKIATLLADALSDRLRQLHFLDHRLTLSVDYDETHLSPVGSDAVQLLLSFNPGQALQPIQDIASGGELSRVLLAAKSILGEADDARLSIFNEIDTGIGGVTASKVASYLRGLAQYQQVICITHLPQIALQAKHHIVIEKHATLNQTDIEIRALSKAEKKAEMTRMIGGQDVSDAILA